MHFSDLLQLTTHAAIWQTAAPKRVSQTRDWWEELGGAGLAFGFQETLVLRLKRQSVFRLAGH